MPLFFVLDNFLICRVCYQKQNMNIFVKLKDMKYKYVRIKIVSKYAY